MNMEKQIDGLVQRFKADITALIRDVTISDVRERIGMIMTKGEIVKMGRPESGKRTAKLRRSRLSTGRSQVHPPSLFSGRKPNRPWP